MLKLLLSIAVFLLPLLAYAQQTQSEEDPFYYKIDGLVYVQKFDVTNKKLKTDLKIPKEPLTFRIVSGGSGKVEGATAATDPTVEYYVVQFFRIADEANSGNASLIALKADNRFVSSRDNNEYFWIKKQDFDTYISDRFIKKRYKLWPPQGAYGANVSLPFKLRPKVGDQNIKITPDITLGGYVGLRLRLSPVQPFYITPMISIGLASLAINDNTTGPTSSTAPATQKTGDGLVFGITRSLGAVFQYNDFQFGLMYGRDTAAGELGKNWIYNNKDWFSFSIGFSFLGAPSQESRAKATAATPVAATP